MKYENTNNGFIKKFINDDTSYIENRNSLNCIGDKLYSYALLIADRKKKKIYRSKFSRTTSQHIGTVENLSNYKTISVNVFDSGIGYTLRNKITNRVIKE